MFTWHLENFIPVIDGKRVYGVNASTSNGLAEVYAYVESYYMDYPRQSDAYAEFNKNPPPGNSPSAFVDTIPLAVLIHLRTYGKIYASAPSPYSEAILRFWIYVYQFDFSTNQWRLVDRGYFDYSTRDYGNMVFALNGEGELIYYSLPAGYGYYSMAASTETIAFAAGATAEANFMSGSYYNYIDYLKIEVGF